LLSDALQPSSPEGRPGGSLGIPDSPRAVVKKRLIAVYLGYRRSATMALAPLTRLQLERGGGPELVALGRKPDLD